MNTTSTTPASIQVTPTTVTFCQQVWQLESTIQLVKHADEKTYLVTETTPFHPVSHIWPDHPADRGKATFDGYSHEIVDCLVGAVEEATGELYVDKQIPVKRDTQGWMFVVVHVLDGLITPQSNLVGLHVDKDYQQALSRGHTAGHLAYLALNKVLAQGYWRKDADRKDPHGNFDFNSYAQETSFVTEDRCVDHYRLGKTLRKRGLNSAQFIEDIAEVEQKVNAVLQVWLSREVDITMRLEGDKLTDSRYWGCDLGEDHYAEIPCGGTHIRNIKEISGLSVSLRKLDEQNIEMHTVVNRNTQ